MVLGALPLLVTRPLPLQDWPNHVARIHVVQGLLDGDPFWARFYRLTGFLIPNAALDLGLLGLSSLGMGVGVAAQVFLLATYVAFVGGLCALSRALGAFDLSKPALAVLLFYSNPLFWGLVSYVLSLGVMLGLLAVWLGSERRGRLLIAGGGAVVLVFTHAVAAAVWPLLLGCFDVFRRGTVRGRMLDLSCVLALVVVAGLLWAMPNGAHDFSMSYAGAQIGEQISHKLLVFADLLLGGSLVQDASSLGALLVCASAVCLGRPRLDVAPGLAVAASALLAIAAPERLGSGSLLDARLAILPVLLLAAAVRVQVRPPAQQALMAAVVVRTLVLAACWQAAGLVFRDYRRQTASLPSGSLVMMAYGTRLSSLTWQQIWSPPITSIATQLVFRDIFMPAIFSNPSEQPIALRPAYRALGQPWNLTDALHARETGAVLRRLCGEGGYRGIYLTVLYPGHGAVNPVGMSLLRARPDFLILDAC